MATPKVTNAAFHNPLSSLDRIVFWSNPDTVGTAYFDNITITTP
ncbi:hypothetical protein [Paenibacillus piri]|nr:hypothetical protein [Paenibacillus piri]